MTRNALLLALVVLTSALLGAIQVGCVASNGTSANDRRALNKRTEPPLTASDAIGLYDSARDASLRLVIEGLDADHTAKPSRALANYQRAVRVDPTNPFAFLALARHHLEVKSTDQAGAFLDQARSLFETEGRLGPAVDVWGLGLRAGIDRARGRTAQADALFLEARRLAPSIWGDERLSAAELR